MDLPPCTHCDGAGEIGDNPTFPRDPQRDVYHRCPWCGGSGVEPSPEEDLMWQEKEAA